MPAIRNSANSKIHPQWIGPVPSSNNGRSSNAMAHIVAQSYLQHSHTPAGRHIRGGGLIEDAPTQQEV